MRIKTSELQRVSLRWAVAKCEGFSPFTDGISWIIEDKWASGTYKQLPYYSTDWADGGPIKTRERISTIIKREGRWVAIIFDPNDEPTYTMLADDELTAAMRCYVASKLGEYVDVPDEVQS